MKSYHPSTPSRRHMTTIPYRKYLTASEPFKALTKGMKRDMGRNSAGRITVRHKGGGNKKRQARGNLAKDGGDQRIKEA
jgi:large subunit ribosomal protein L2